MDIYVTGAQVESCVFSMQEEISDGKDKMESESLIFFLQRSSEVPHLFIDNHRNIWFMKNMDYFLDDNNLLNKLIERLYLLVGPIFLTIFHC